MKKILAIAAAAALTAGVSAFAANPFSDVTPDDWAYQAVSDLSDQGVVEGYPDGTFKGERNVTRYEIAQIVARLMAKEDQLNAEQQATLNKLAGEYADELANLGVRVSNLEKKVGNIYWSGDARMRYQDKGNGAENWDGRMRINVKAQVNDSTTINGRLTNNMNFKTAGASAAGSDDGDTYMDVLNATHKFGKDVTVKLGRYANNFGNPAGWLYGDSSNFDGAELSYNNGKLWLATGFGEFNKGYDTEITTSDVYYARGAYDFSFAKVGVDYLAAKNAEGYGLGTNEVFGANLTIPVGEFRAFGEYWKNTTYETGDDTAWNAGIGYGKLNLKKPGSFAIDVAYNDVDQGVYFGAAGLQTNALSYLGEGATNVTFWNVMADVALQKNVYLHGEYAFGVDTENYNDDDDSWSVSLNYVF
jgi:hypothetical protein